VIPEVTVCEEKAKEIYEKIGFVFKIKICITGPYTLASMFVNRDSHLFRELGRVLSNLIDRNIFSVKYGKVTLVAVDEPVFNLIDDPLLDRGYDGREELLKAWETIFHEIKSKGVQSILHLHNTANDMFWQIESLDIVESHVNDPISFSPKTKEYLTHFDKFLKASICVTDFDALIRNFERSRGITDEAEISQRVAETWVEIKKRNIDPVAFLESKNLIANRLRRMINQYGERVTYAGPECGLSSFPTYDCALECLRRVAEATKQVNSERFITSV
jgi:5-methyltetrahydropteroyltriglutamate--homocysteine methyltransferase